MLLCYYHHDIRTAEGRPTFTRYQPWSSSARGPATHCYFIHIFWSRVEIVRSRFNSTTCMMYSFSLPSSSSRKSFANGGSSLDLDVLCTLEVPWRTEYRKREHINIMWFKLICFSFTRSLLFEYELYFFFFGYLMSLEIFLNSVYILVLYGTYTRSSTRSLL